MKYQPSQKFKFKNLKLKMKNFKEESRKLKLYSSKKMKI